MKFNISKSKVMSFCRNAVPVIFNESLNNIILGCVNEFYDLGITVSSNLSWNKHIDKMCRRAMERSGFVKRKIGYG